MIRIHCNHPRHFDDTFRIQKKLFIVQGDASITIRSGQLLGQCRVERGGRGTQYIHLALLTDYDIHHTGIETNVIIILLYVERQGSMHTYYPTYT